MPDPNADPNVDHYADHKTENLQPAEWLKNSLIREAKISFIAYDDMV